MNFYPCFLNLDITCEILISNIKDKARGTVLHNGEALSKLNVALDGYKYKWNH